MWININEKDEWSSSHCFISLLHEMLHVELYDYRGHGKPFKKRLAELAAKGAFNPWL
jgi:hypothetical protein